MFERIKTFLRRIFPMSAASLEQRMQALEGALKDALWGQRELAVQIDCLQKSFHGALSHQEALSSENSLKLEELVQQLQTERCSLDGKLEETCQAIQATQREAIREYITRLDVLEEARLPFHQEVSERLNGISDGIIQLRRELQDITGGDIFRRIEFLQGKLLHLELLVQSNLLTVDEQRLSSTYPFLLRMRALFPIMAVDHPKGFVRIGREHDGGYVMLDDFENRKIAYSFGISDDVSWDTDIARRGLNVYMYDHTIDGLPKDNERFHFFRIGLCAEGAQTDHLKSLSELIQRNGHSGEYGMILKVDIEGAEWDVLCKLEEMTLKHFSQIVFEFHGLTFPDNEKKIRTAMERLNRTHQLVHIHANNYGSYIQLGGAVLPELIEGTYLLREEYHFMPQCQDNHWKPDSANNPYLPDIFLGGWDTQADS